MISTSVDPDPTSEERADADMIRGLKNYWQFVWFQLWIWPNILIRIKDRPDPQHQSSLFGGDETGNILITLVYYHSLIKMSFLILIFISCISSSSINSKFALFNGTFKKIIFLLIHFPFRVDEAGNIILEVNPKDLEWPPTWNLKSKDNSLTHPVSLHFIRVFLWYLQTRASNYMITGIKR